MEIFCAIVAVLCLLYYLVIVIYAGITADFAWIWILAAGVLSILCAGIHYGKNHPGFFPEWLKYVIAVVALVCIILFCILCLGVLRGMTWKGSEDLDYVVVLGAQVKGDAPSRALTKRLIKAYEYAEENPDTILILSGGQGSGENITEAKCMKDWLVSEGVSEDRMILEEQSTDTKENLLFSDQMTSCAKKRTGILSNNFHVFRAVRLAEKLGYIMPEGIAAASDPVMQVHYVVREVFALVKEILKGNI